MAHLALFLPDLNAGGAERVMLQLAREMISRGHRVDLVLARAQGVLLGRVPAGLRLIDLAVDSRLPGRLGLGVGTVLALSRYLRDQPPDTLLSTLTGANLAAILARLLGSRRRIRLVLREACGIGNLNGKFYRGLVARLYRHADRIIAVSVQIKDDLSVSLGLPQDRVRCIYNPVDISGLEDSAQCPPDHLWYRDHDRPLILGCGRLVEQKDFATLIRAFARVRQGRAARLLILGEGPLRGELEALVSELGLQEDVMLPGFVENPYPFLRYADLFVLSSAWEGFPNVLVEALALGVPAVATDCNSGPREMLELGKYGRLSPVGDPVAMACAITESLSSPPRRDRLIDSARRFEPGRISSLYERELFPTSE